MLTRLWLIRLEQLLFPFVCLLPSRIPLAHVSLLRIFQNNKQLVLATRDVENVSKASSAFLKERRAVRLRFLSFSAQQLSNQRFDVDVHSVHERLHNNAFRVSNRCSFPLPPNLE